MQNIMSIRSLLYVPGDQERMIEKSLTLKSDGLIFDLEDSVSHENKAVAREILDKNKRILHETGRLFYIRVNGVDTEYFENDLRLAIDLKADGIILPKGTKDAVAAAETFFRANERDEQYLRIIPLIETAYCVEHISETLDVSDRIIAGQFGAEDLTRDLGIERTSGGDELSYTRNRFVIACRARNIGAIDTPYPDFNDEEGLTAETKKVKNMGMTGKTCIHPNQIDIVNQLFSPTQEEILQAKEIVNLFTLEENKTRGVVVIDGKMVDKPVLERAERVLAKAALYEIRD